MGDVSVLGKAIILLSLYNIEEKVKGDWVGLNKE